jgi:hypothetical protein
MSLTGGMSAGMTIGVFARRSRLSLKALRLDEQLGLAWVDPSSVRGRCCRATPIPRSSAT